MLLPGYLSRHSDFIGNVATLMSGKSIAAAIALFTTPIVARLFEPGDFGVAAVFVSIVTITSNVASLRYESAFSLPGQEQEARSLVAVAYCALFIVCTVFLGSVAAMQAFAPGFPAFDVLGGWAWFLPLGVLVLGFLQIQEGWLTRRKRFKLSSVALVLGNSVTSGSRIAFGAAVGSSVYGLITGWFFGIVTRLLTQRSAASGTFSDMTYRVCWKDVQQTARAYADFPKLNAPAGLVFALGGNLPVLLFGTLFSPGTAGFFAMANRLAHVPVTIAVSSVRRVFLQKAAAIRNRGGGLRKAFLLTTGGLALLGAVPVFLMSMFGQPVTGWLLGERWVEAGRYIEIIAPWMFMVWVTAPANPVFVVLRQQKLWLLLQISLTILRLAAFGLAYSLGASPVWTLQAFVAATIANNVLTIMIAFVLISKAAADGAASAGEDDSKQIDE